MGKRFPEHITNAERSVHVREKERTVILPEDFLSLFAVPPFLFNKTSPEPGQNPEYILPWLRSGFVEKDQSVRQRGAEFC